MSYTPEYAIRQMQWMTQVVLELMVLAAAVSAIIAPIFHVFRAIGLYSKARCRRIRHAWLAWIPVGNAWITGSISDQYQYVVKGRIRHRRLVLVLLSAGTLVLQLVVAVLSVNLMANFAVMLIGFGSPEQLMRILPVASIGLLLLLCVAAAICKLVFHYIAMYDYYISSNPSCGALFLVMGILFNFLEPFFLFACRKREDGMPPRRSTLEAERAEQANCSVEL